MRRFILGAIEQEVRPRKTPSDSIIMRMGAQYKVLVGTGGAVTAAGRLWEEHTGNTLLAWSYDVTQTPSRTGNVERIKVRGGAEKIVRTWDAAADEGRGEYRYTALGKRFFATERDEYIVRVPAVFTGTRANGTVYIREGLWPVHEPVKVKATWTRAQKDAYIKMVMVNRYSADGGIIAEYSQETVRLQEGGQWHIVQMTTSPGDLALPDIVERPLGARPASISGLPFPEAIVASAFESRDDMHCCIRQLAEVSRTEEAVVSDIMDEAEKALYGTQVWRENGCTSRMIFEYARLTGRGAALLHGERSIEVLAGKNPLVWTVVGSHAYFYGCPKVRRQLMNRRHADFQRIRRECRESTTPDASEWLSFAYPPRPGHYWVDEGEIDATRARFLEDGRQPKVTLKDETRTRSLCYKFTKVDGEQGACVVHSMPLDAGAMMEWLRTLGCGLKYRGQGLPSLTYQVVVHLIKQKERRYLEGEERYEVMERNGFTCALCGGMGRFEMDHSVRLSQSYGEQTPDKFENLCAECHQMKSTDEPREFDSDPLASHVDRHVWDEYVTSPRPPPLIYKNEQVDRLVSCRIADVVRCRYRPLPQQKT